MSTIDEKAALIQPHITPEFIRVLVETGRIIGWSVDYSEARSFIEEVCRLGNQPIPSDEEFQPYEHGGDD